MFHRLVLVADLSFGLMGYGNFGYQVTLVQIKLVG